MSSVDAEIARLSHKDVRIRRRAVRTLFDFNSSNSLKGFIPLLDDSDPWFRTKAINAHRKWAKSEDDLHALSNRDDIDTKRIAAELLEKISAPKIARKLLEDDDHVTRAFAAKALSLENDLHSTMALDSHHSIRVISATFSKDPVLISGLIEDVHSSVRRAAISTAAKEGMHLEDSTINKAMTASDPSLRALIASLCVSKGGEMLRKSCNDTNPKVRNSIAKTLRKEIKDVDERIKLVAKVAPDIVVRWLRSRHGENASDLRWSLIENVEVNSRTRSKLLEQMSGRTNIDFKRLENIVEDESALVRIAANNLSASVSELKGEEA
jgi:HEAT repeat protein